MSEEIRILRGALTECHRELSALRQENAKLALQAHAAEVAKKEAFEQLRIVRSSIAWKLATPERVLREMLRS